MSFILSSAQVYAKENYNKDNSTQYWLNAGIGVSDVGCSSGINLSYSFGNSLISLRYIGNTSIELFRNREVISDIAIMYGRKLLGNGLKTENSWASISAGVSNVKGTRHGELIYVDEGGFAGLYEEIPINSFGFPIEFQYFYKLHYAFGIGLYAFADFNSKWSFGGILVCLQYGKLK